MLKLRIFVEEIPARYKQPDGSPLSLAQAIELASHEIFALWADEEISERLVLELKEPQDLAAHEIYQAPMFTREDISCHRLVKLLRSESFMRGEAVSEVRRHTSTVKNGDRVSQTRHIVQHELPIALSSLYTFESELAAAGLVKLPVVSKAEVSTATSKLPSLTVTFRLIHVMKSMLLEHEKTNDTGLRETIATRCKGEVHGLQDSNLSTLFAEANRIAKK